MARGWESDDGTLGLPGLPESPGILEAFQSDRISGRTRYPSE